MKKYLYSQYDSRANFYNHPMISEVEPTAFSENIARSIKLCTDASKLSAIADCKLKLLGTFDDVSGKFDILKEPQVICECDILVESTGFTRGTSQIN